MVDQQNKRRGSKLLRRKSKSDQSVDGSIDSKSSKRSLASKLFKRKSKKGKNGESLYGADTAIPENREAEVQQAFLNSNSNNNSTKNDSASRAATEEAAKKPYMLKIALLLVDAATRRFELLQLEFDSDKALVSDALSQIPIHVTEKVLSSQTYTGVSGASGMEQKRTVPLFDFCKGNDVLVAIPQGTSAQECARLAKPILSDTKVIGMLSTSGINADPWTTAQFPSPRSTPKKSSASRGVGQEEKSGKGTTYLFVAIAVVVLAVAVYFARTKFAGGSGSGGEWPPIHMDLDPVWNGCSSVCGASKSFVEKYIVAPPTSKD